MISLTDAVSDYCTSNHFLFLDGPVKEHAETLLAQWAAGVGNDMSLSGIEKSLEAMARLDVPLDVKKSIPRLLIEFFSYLETTAMFPDAARWASDTELLESRYMERFRDDGSLKGETFRHKASGTGRNDPCPCGSGKKFKKCCMGLIA